MIPRLALASVLLTAGLSAAPANPVAFDWFEYAGRDDVFAGPLETGAYRNPILAGFYPDPSICRVGDDYYLINSTFAYFPGIPIFHSRDLVNWRQIGHAIHRPGQLKYDGLGVSRAIFAPAISHHRGTFYIVCTMVDGGGNFLVTATDPAGPWSDPVWFDFEGIDPSLYFDDATGRAWMINNGAPAEPPRYDGHRAIWIQEFDIAARRLIGPRQVLVNGGVDLAQKPVWIEGPHLYRRGDWYYLCAAEGGTSDNHSQVIFRAKSPTGPFEPWSKNPILTQRDLDGSAPLAVTSTGHADLEIGPDGNWWAVFLGCRPFEGRWYTTGRETFLLPVQWTDDGWPVILPPQVRVPAVVPAPNRAALAATPAPLNGNFTWRDDFSAPELSPLWIMLRAPHDTWWKADAPAGLLQLTPRRETLSGTGNPSYLARRLQHQRFTVSTRLTVPPAAGGSAGLVAFQGEKHHFYCGVRRTETGLEVFVEHLNGGPATITARAGSPAGEPVELRLDGTDGRGVFAFRTGGRDWQQLAEVDLRTITTQAAGGFVGATVGLHARLEP